MPVQVNTIAVHKITGEEVWVLRLNTTEAGFEFETALVRRPTQTSDGVKHIEEVFRVAELESLEDSYTRKRERTRRERNEQLADQAELQQKIMQLKPTKPSYSFEQEPPYEVQ